MNDYPIDLFVELQSFRSICDNPERAKQAEDLLKKTNDIKQVDELCKSFLMADKAVKLLNNSQLNKRFMQATFDNFIKVTPIQIEAFKKVKLYSENIQQNLKNGTNLIIAGYGCVGTGKTMLASALSMELMTTKGIPCKFINVLSLISKLKETFNNQEYIDVEILIIDDLGKEKNTEWVSEQIYSIINNRYEHMKPTVITIENDINSLKVNYQEKGKAIISRLCENFILVKLTGTDYRLSK